MDEEKANSMMPEETEMVDEYEKEIQLSEEIIGAKQEQHVSLIVGSWIGLSVILTFFNKYILTTLDFPYPIFLTSIHMIVITIGTRIVDFNFQSGGEVATTEEISWRVWFRTIIPISILFSASLILSNMAFVHLDVSIIQMIKALTPIITLIIQLAVGLKEYNNVLLACILLPTIGGIIASQAQNSFSSFGLLCQLGAVFTEAGRMIVAQITLSNYSLTPSKCIKMYAPVCAIVISCMVPLIEGFSPFRDFHKVGALLLATNALIAWALNMGSMNVIRSVGSLALSLFGYVKDVVIITISVTLLGSHISALQWFGYLLTLLGAGTYRITGGQVNDIQVEMVLQPFLKVRDLIKESVDKWKGADRREYQEVPV